MSQQCGSMIKILLGLKIWGSWQGINHVQDRPLFEGRATIAMAREVYGIRDPADRQMSFL